MHKVQDFNLYLHHRTQSINNGESLPLQSGLTTTELQKINDLTSTLILLITHLWKPFGVSIPDSQGDQPQANGSNIPILTRVKLIAILTVESPQSPHTWLTIR